MNACTIVTRSYLPRARVVAASFLRSHPDGRFTALVIDDPGGRFDGSDEPFDVIRPDVLDIAEDEYALLASIYDVVGLASALKPKLLEYLIDGSGGPVLFLDSDMEVFAPLNDLAELAEQHGVVLSPHTISSPPDDGLHLSETALLRTGVFNSGFLATGTSAGAFLEWWWTRVRRDCIEDPNDGLFYEQRWLDLAVPEFGPYVLRDVTVNVAFWNLHERHMTRAADGRWLVNGAPLRLFHFSGYDTDTPFLLTVHQATAPRILFSEHPLLKELCDGYADRLTAAGWERFRRLSYGYARTGTGFPIDLRSRRLLREAVLDAEDAGEPIPPRPFGPSAGEGHGFVEWLQQPRTGDSPSRLGRYLERLWLDRADLQRAFPNGRDHDAGAFRDWCADVRASLGIPRQVLTVRRREPMVRVARRPRSGGVNIVGPLLAENGAGERARLLHATLQFAGIPSSPIVYRVGPSRESHPFKATGDGAEYDINLVVVDAGYMHRFADDVGHDFFEGRYTVGVWTCETDTLPVEATWGVDLVDEIWTPSEFSARAFRDVTDNTVTVMPHPIVAPPVPANITRMSFGLPGGFMFLSSFDHLSGLDRKNPLGLIEAYCEAFAEGDGAILVVKSTNGDLCRVDRERLWAAAAERADVFVLDGYLDADARGGLLSLSDAYVSLHRATSFGLSISEAMALAKPVIATAYSGNLEYMTSANSSLVPFSFTLVGPDAEPHPADALWAEPDLEAAARGMYDVFSHPEETKANAAQARLDLGDSHSIAVRATLVDARLEAIRTSR